MLNFTELVASCIYYSCCYILQRYIKEFKLTFVHDFGKRLRYNFLTFLCDRPKSLHACRMQVLCT